MKAIKTMNTTQRIKGQFFITFQSSAKLAKIPTLR